MDLFDKCYAFKKHEEVKAMGLYPYFQPIYENYGPIVKMDGREIVMAGSNNYLGLTTDPRVKEAAIEAIKKIWDWMFGVKIFKRYLGHSC